MDQNDLPTFPEPSPKQRHRHSVKNDTARWIPWMLCVGLGASTIWFAAQCWTKSSTPPATPAANLDVPPATPVAQLSDPADLLRPLNEQELSSETLAFLRVMNPSGFRWAGGKLEGWIEGNDGRRPISIEWPDRAQDFAGTVVVADIATDEGMESCVWIKETAVVPDWPPDGKSEPLAATQMWRVPQYDEDRKKTLRELFYFRTIEDQVGRVVGIEAGSPHRAIELRVVPRLRKDDTAEPRDALDSR